MVRSHSHARPIMGSAAIVRQAYQGCDLVPLFETLQARIAANPRDAGAMIDLSTLLLVAGQREAALELQRTALGVARLYVTSHGTGDGLRVVAFKCAGDLMANTPVEFLLEGSNIVLYAYYVDETTVDLSDVPDHDVAILAVGEAEASRATLAHLGPRLATWHRPVLNGTPRLISALNRIDVAKLFQGEPHVAVASVVTMGRATLELLAGNTIGLSLLLPGGGFPILLRPLGSHAGQGLEKIDCVEDIAPYLAARGEDEFYVMQYLPYASSDGLFRKYRIAFIDGIAYASHMAISSHWMVHYLNADMEATPERRDEEAAWMAAFDTQFAQRHARAFEALVQQIGLDYFGIDCAELPDGRLLLFEADVAMIVHALDSETLFPYKKPAMRKLFDAFEAGLQRRHERARQQVAVTCAHTGKPAVYQRSRDDCMICALAMMTGRSYEEVVALASAISPNFPTRGPMSHSVMRNVGHRWGYALLSGIYMDWNVPAIIGVRSPMGPDSGHAVFWDGEKLIDPGTSLIIDRSYVDRHGFEFTLPARDLAAIVGIEAGYGGVGQMDKARLRA